MRGMLWGAVGVWLGCAGCEVEEQDLCDRFQDRVEACGVTTFDHAACTEELAVCSQADAIAVQGYLDCVGFNANVEDYVCGRPVAGEEEQEALERLITCGTGVNAMEAECRQAFSSVSAIPGETGPTTTCTTGPI